MTQWSPLLRHGHVFLAETLFFPPPFWICWTWDSTINFPDESLSLLCYIVVFKLSLTQWRNPHSTPIHRHWEKTLDASGKSTNKQTKQNKKLFVSSFQRYIRRNKTKTISKLFCRTVSGGLSSLVESCQCLVCTCISGLASYEARQELEMNCHRLIAAEHDNRAELILIDVSFF